MGSNERRRLVVNADDFGHSASINEAVVRAHQEGILTTASLMVSHAACAEAVALAEKNPTLGVGLHLTLVCGRAASPSSSIPGLATRGEFSSNPVSAGMNYFFRGSLRPQLEHEIETQIVRFRETGLTLDHVNGHLNIHLHPTVLDILLSRAREWGIRAVRLTSDPLGLNLKLASGRWGYRLSHALVFGLLARRARSRMDACGVRYTSRVFGLLQTAHVNENFLLKLLARLPAGDSELYSHPCVERFKDEFEGLISPKVRQIVREAGILLIRYQDL